MPALLLDINKENEALRARIREVEDENQELQAQSLIQNRTILGMRNELALMRIQLNEMAVTSALLTERVRQMMQQPNANQLREYENGRGQITAPPLMAPPPPPPPPPISPTYIRITPRQVGAGEALMTRLGLTVPTPPRHRIKRDIRQSVRRLSRSPIERPDLNDNTSAQTSLVRSKNGLSKIPQIQGFSQASDFNGSASDSSDSEEDSQSCQRRKRDEGGVVQKTILQNYNFKFPPAKIFINWERKGKDNQTVPSTSRMEDFTFIETDSKISKVSDCVQYTFPNVHEGSHQSHIHSVVTAIGQNVRAKQNDESDAPKMDDKKDEESAATSHDNRSEDETPPHPGFESESQSSTDEDIRRKESERVMPCIRSRRFEVEQDGFQADESSNCITSTENSLERVAISKADLEKN